MSYPAPQFCSATGTEVFDLTYCAQTGPTVTRCVAGAKPGFKGSAASRAGYKIYVALNADGVHYVGCTCTRMSSRLRLGYRSSKDGQNGYHGYKWLSKPGLQLYVFHLQGLVHPAPDDDTRLATQKVAERIEAELVYAVRAATGQWPLSQHEIHFHNLAENKELAQLTTRIAHQLYEQLPFTYSLTPANP
ncbi:hypothetical protein HER32_16735 [Hymenobacter sp. BT18]|uniref:hypothetical protein n=1 Tax=Hymenobacter sp. BT18 TaxID=2835648 RepID=UPI00143E76DE|nr:hypothetical protein [Hymenobacter sp. BT18]QIX62729.1 hypothetical protein HER32_16735 [Hymenobacter sp. BT18]